MGATGVANATPQPVPAKQHDPIKVAEGMFNGSIDRIGRALRDRGYVASSKVILAECAKKYQDALDDCEIQILDAKWYLESKLAENRARREAEAKAKEASSTTAATKRKHEEIEDTSESLRPDAPAKRARSNEPPSPRATAAAVQNLSSARGKDTTAESDKKPQGSTTKPQDTAKNTSQPPEQEKAKGETKTEPQARTETQHEQQLDNDEFLKSSPQGTPGMDNGDYIFESMFGEPAETNDSSAMDNDNMDGEFPFGDDFSGQNTTNAASASVPAGTTDNQSQSQPQNQSQNSNPLSSLLAGVEQFANQADDANNLGLDGTAPDLNNANDQQPPGDNVFTADFGPNIFDMEFNDENNFAMDDIENIGDPGQQEINFDEF